MAALVLAVPVIGLFRRSRYGQFGVWIGGPLLILVGCCAYPLMMINGTGNNLPHCTGDTCDSAAGREVIGYGVMGGMATLTILQRLLIVDAAIMLVVPAARRYFQPSSSK